MWLPKENKYARKSLAHPVKANSAKIGCVEVSVACVCCVLSVLNQAWVL